MTLDMARRRSPVAGSFAVRILRVFSGRPGRVLYTVDMGPNTRGIFDFLCFQNASANGCP